MQIKITELSNYQLVEPILDFKLGEEYIDLHNDFNCIDIKQDLQEIVFHFSALSDANQKIAIQFDNAQMAKNNFALKDHSKYSTLSNFHRGKFETENHTLLEKNENGQVYFYLEFLEGLHLEIFAQRVWIWAI